MNIFELLMGIGRFSFIIGVVLILGGILIFICGFIAFLPVGLIGGPAGMVLSIPTSIFALWLFVKVVKDTVIGKGD